MNTIARVLLVISLVLSNATVSLLSSSAHADTRIYFTENNTNIGTQFGQARVNSILINGTDKQTHLSNLNSARAITYDSVGRKIYFFNAINGAISRMNLDGSGVVASQIDVDSSQAVNISIDNTDVTGARLYWPDEGSNRIRRAKLDGSATNTLISPTQQTFILTIDIASGFVFYAQTNSIRKVAFTASNLSAGADTLVNNASNPSALAVDQVNHLLYYSTASTIRRCNLDGTNDTLVVPSGLSGTGGSVGNIAFDQANNKMYWTLVIGTKIRQANLDGSNPSDFLTGLAEPFGIVVTDADITAPAAPSINSPLTGTSSKTGQPVLSGTSEALSTVEVSADAVVLGTTVTDGNGAWAFTPSSALADGTRVFTARAIDSFSNASSTSNSVSVLIDTIPPAAATITDPVTGSQTRDSTPSFSGTADVGTTVKILVDGTLDGSATTSVGGTWLYTPGSALADGAHQIAAVASDSAGNDATSSATISITIDSTAPQAPVAATPAPAERVKQLSSLKGSAEPNSTVTVIVNGTSAGSTTTSSSGAWVFSFATPLGLGDYAIQFTATDIFGNVSQLTQINVSVVGCVEVSRTDVAATLSQKTTSFQNLYKAALSLNKKGAKKSNKCHLISNTEKSSFSQSFTALKRLIANAALPKSEFVCDPVPVSCTTKSIATNIKSLRAAFGKVQKISGSSAIGKGCAKTNSTTAAQILTESVDAKAAVNAALDKFGKTVVLCK